MEPFIGEIRTFAINFAPSGWAFCEGQILQINQYQALFSLIGTTYGGNGVTTFALPDLRGRVPLHVSPTIPLGTSQGEAAHTLTAYEMPQHTHQVNASTGVADSPDPTEKVWAQVSSPYHSAASLSQMNSGAIGNTGGSQPHDNMQPYQAVRFCIALQGIFPTRN